MTLVFQEPFQFSNTYNYLNKKPHLLTFCEIIWMALVIWDWNSRIMSHSICIMPKIMKFDNQLISFWSTFSLSNILIWFFFSPIDFLILILKCDFFHNFFLQVLNYLIPSTIYKNSFPCWLGGSSKTCNCLLETLMDFHGDSMFCITLQLLLTHHHLIINWFVDNMYYVVFLYSIWLTHLPSQWNNNGC